MAENSKIEWTDHTFNPWIGCTKVSPACDHCYAEALNRRWGRDLWGAGKPRQRTAAANWLKPIGWNKKAAAEGVRRRVFCASLADVFDAEVADAWRDELFALVCKTPHLDWLVLTKRPQVAWRYFEPYRVKGPPSNVWLGTTVENQTMADLRIPKLLSIPATVHFLSCEPLLGPLDLSKVRWGHANALTGLDWVICGGESGPGARMMPADAARDLRDQCRTAGVHFFMKQMTAKAPIPADLLVREFPNALLAKAEAR